MKELSDLIDLLANSTSRQDRLSKLTELITTHKEMTSEILELYNEAVMKERAEYQMKTAIGVAEKLSQVKLLGMMVIGGDNKNGQALNPFDAVGLESFMRISDKLSNKK